MGGFGTGPGGHLTGAGQSSAEDGHGGGEQHAIRMRGYGTGAGQSFAENGHGGGEQHVIRMRGLPLKVKDDEIFGLIK